MLSCYCIAQECHVPPGCPTHNPGELGMNSLEEKYDWLEMSRHTGRPKGAQQKDTSAKGIPGDIARSPQDILGVNKENYWEICT